MQLPDLRLLVSSGAPGPSSVFNTFSEWWMILGRRNQQASGNTAIYVHIISHFATECGSIFDVPQLLAPGVTNDSSVVEHLACILGA
jgi:hypothetical protein